MKDGDTTAGTDQKKKRKVTPLRYAFCRTNGANTHEEDSEIDLEVLIYGHDRCDAVRKAQAAVMIKDGEEYCTIAMTDPKPPKLTF